MSKIKDTYTTIRAVDERPDGTKMVILSFAEKNLGYGEIIIVQTPEGHLFIDSGHMAVSYIRNIIGRLVDTAAFDWSQDPYMHRRYNEAMGTINCNCGCGWNGRAAQTIPK